MSAFTIHGLLLVILTAREASETMKKEKTKKREHTTPTQSKGKTKDPHTLALYTSRARGQNRQGKPPPDDTYEDVGRLSRRPPSSLPVD